MNRFLDFRNKTLEKEFYESHHLSKSKSNRLINIMIGCFAVTYTCRYIADILFNPDYVLISTFAGLGIIYGAIGLFYLGRHLITRFKPRTNKIDITVLVVALVAVMGLNNPYRNPKISCDPSYSIFWDSFEIGVFNLIIILQMRRWYHKAVYFALLSTFLISVYHNSIYDTLMSIKIVGFIVLVSFIFYFMEKSMRLNFLEKYHQEVSTKHILSALPEGIIIIDDIFQCLHSNPSMEKMFPELDPENKISVQAFMKSIKDPKPRVFFPDFKNQISEKIFLAQEKIRNGGRMRSNSIISEEGASPNSTTNNYKPIANVCSSIAKPNRKGLLYGLLRKDKEELKTIRLDSNEGTATGTGTGTSPTSFVPQSISLFTYIQAFFEAFQGSNTGKLDYENVLEHHYFDAKHDDKTLEISLSFIDFLNKRCFLLIFRDKTHRDLIEKLESSTKYKSRVLSTVSHELRTPVTSSLHLLNASMESSEIPAKCVENYIRPASRVLVMMLNLINDILDYSQLKEEKLKVVFQPVDIRNIITEALSLIEIQAKKKGIALRLDFDPLIPSLFETDPNRFTQILLNLLSNALKFTSKGEITVSAFTITDEEAQGLLEISVKDTGIGIKEADAKKLFVEFEKIDLGEDQKMNSNGCGLGLNIANRLAKHLSREQFGGIKVTSQVGKGSVFSFVIENKRRLRQSLGRLNSKAPKASLFRASKANSLVGSRKMSDILDVSIHNITEIKDDEDPVYKKLQKQSFARGSCKRDYNINISSIAPTTQENYLFGGPVSDEDEYDADACTCPKILIVDDDAFNLLTLETILTSLNYTVKSCFNGEEAVREVMNRHETKVCGQGCANFQFIFMDSNMPIKTGPEAAMEIKQYLQENGLSAIPIIGLSSYCMNEENKELMANMDFCLEKPVTKEKIKDLLWTIKEEDFSRL